MELEGASRNTPKPIEHLDSSLAFPVRNDSPGVLIRVIVEAYEHLASLARNHDLKIDRIFVSN